MSCTMKGEGTDSCVCEAIRKVIAAQKKVFAYKSSCENPIQALRTNSKKEYRHTTIPFMLYKRGDEKPFIASGVHQTPIKEFEHEHYYKCIESPVVRARHMNEDCCVALEILRVVNANGFPVADRGEELCDFFRDQTPYKTVQFQETGICLTIDVSSFSGITCLAPTTPLPKRCVMGDRAQSF